MTIRASWAEPVPSPPYRAAAPSPPRKLGLTLRTACRIHPLAPPSSHPAWLPFRGDGPHRAPVHAPGDLMQAHHGPARWHNLGERHRPSFHIPPVRQHLRSHRVLVWARLFLEPVSRRSRDSRDASGRHRPGRRGRRRSHPRGWVSILPVHLPVEWPPPRVRGTETAPTTKKTFTPKKIKPRRVLPTPPAHSEARAT
jgi:hypothetical protein